MFNPYQVPKTDLLTKLFIFKQRFGENTNPNGPPRFITPLTLVPTVNPLFQLTLFSTLNLNV